MKVKILELNVPTTTGRTFTTQVGEDIVRQINDCAKNGGTMFGEIGSSGGTGISLANVSHAVTSAELLDGCVWAEIQLLDTPKGAILRSLLEQKELAEHQPEVDYLGYFGVRGTGIVDENKFVTNYTLIAVDFYLSEAAWRE